MTSNYDRSKTIISKTTKNYHPRADDPRLLIIWQKTEDEKLLPVYNCTLKVCLPQRLVSNFSCLSLKIVKLAFHWRWIFAFFAIWHVAADGVTWICISKSLPVVKWSITHTKMLFFFFLFWPGHSQKNAFLERANKRVYTTLRFLTVYFYRSHPGDHRKQGEKLQCKGQLRGGWGQGEIVFEGHWLKSLI